MFDADIFIEGGVIKEVGQNLIIPGGTKVIDAKGKLVMPGKHQTKPNRSTQSYIMYHNCSVAA